jgi:hypothetical protein
MTFVSVFVFLLLSCGPASKISVNNVNDTGTPQTGTFVFALPLTVIDIQVTAEETSIVPGPYYKYAEKYLGIKGAAEKEVHIWNILRMQVNTHIEADPDYIYTVKGTTKAQTHPGIKELMADGLILPSKSFSANQVVEYSYPPGQGELIFADLSVKRNFEADKDINISLAMPDSDNESRPATRSGLKEKTLEQKAEEAANFLIKLKKRRFKLVSGQYSYMPQGEALSDALKELARLEEVYLSLFIGKKEKTVYQKHYTYIPVAGKINDSAVLLRFSIDNGFVDSREADGVPVVLETRDSEKTKALDQYNLPYKPSINKLHYRIADQVSIKLKAGEQVWAEAILPVFQCGAIIPMPLEK